MLPPAEEVAGSAQLQVLFSDLEAVVGGGESLQTALCFIAAALRDQNAIAFGAAAAYAATQLVQLAQAEALGVFHHHQRGVGPIHATTVVDTRMSA